MKNLTIKTFLTFLIMSYLIMGAVYVCLYLFTPYSMTKKNAVYIETESKALADQCMGITKSEAEKLIYEFVGRTGAEVALVDAKTYLRDYDSSYEEETEADSDVPSYDSGLFTESEDNMLTYPLRFSDSEEEYMLCLTSNSARTEDFQRCTVKTVPVMLVMAFVLSFVGANIFSYYIKKPIVRMSKIAEKMAEQNFDWYCPDERDDEIGVLAKSLNKLSDELSSALVKLNDKNLYLKNEIALEKERERRRMLFFAGVSHELKTPISVVIGQIEGMRLGVGVYKDRDKYLAKCSATLNELVSFINEILLVSHIDMGEDEEKKIVKIDGILDEVIAFYDELMTQKEIELEYHVPDDVDFRGDEQLLKKALGNVIGNAVKYTPQGGTVRIDLFCGAKVSEPDVMHEEKHDIDRVELIVMNSPCHIDEQHLPHLFEAFYRADPGNTDGSGLGLYITGMVLEMFGAEYGIRNAEDGVEFRIVQ